MKEFVDCVKPGIFVNKNFFAFTLAEVLITLGIIGVVAALTLPPLIQHYKDKATVVRLKKVYSTFSQAHEFLKNDDEYTPEQWNLIANNSIVGAENILKYYMKYVKSLKICNRNNGCFPKDLKYKNLKGNANYFVIDSYQNFAKAIMNDGTLVYAWANTASCTDSVSHCGTITVDVNGYKAPNQLGVDTFEFYMLPKGIYPASADPSDANARCSRKNSNMHNGKSCTKWVLLYENLDYRYCDGLSFNGKHKCK